MLASGLYFGINWGGPIASQGSLGILQLLCGGHAITLVSALRLLIFSDNLRYCLGLFFNEACQYSMISRIERLGDLTDWKAHQKIPLRSGRT